MAVKNVVNNEIASIFSTSKCCAGFGFGVRAICQGIPTGRECITRESDGYFGEIHGLSVCLTE